MKITWLIVAAAVAFIAALLTHIPAGLVYSKLHQEPGGFDLYGLDGSLHEGSADGFAMQGRPLPEALHWRLRPAWLLLGQAAAHVDGSGPITFEALVRKGPFGGLRLGNLRGDSALKPVFAIAGLGFAPIDGRIRLDLNSIELADGFPMALDGSLHIENLAWSLAQTPLALGDFDAVAKAGPNGPVLEVLSPHGPLETSGNITLLPAGKTYAVDLALKPRMGADPQLQNLLQSLGPPDADGSYHLRQNGSF